ncbi:MAG: response regulator [Chloroflexi bacterium]|nr:response regulator [Chloroflexota bacterium]
MRDAGGRVLIIDDERPIRRFLSTVLQAHDYATFEASSGEDGLAAVTRYRPDVVILDLGLPGIDGIEVTRRLREWTTIPIIILSVRDQEADKIAALDAGADDYLTKPFGTGELMARLRATLRRAVEPAGTPVLSFGDLTVDFTRRRVTRGTEEIQLTPTEYDLLRVLVSNAGKVVTHQQLLRQVWGEGYDGEVHLLRVNISNLRRKVEPEPARPRFVTTEPGIGYRFRDG